MRIGVTAASVEIQRERVRYPVVRLVAWLSDELARRLGYAE
jgi:hypothetical protein